MNFKLLGQQLEKIHFGLIKSNQNTLHDLAVVDNSKIKNQRNDCKSRTHLSNHNE